MTEGMEPVLIDKLREKKKKKQEISNSRTQLIKK